ncbi:MAG: CpaD family pilus assembly lipoprotein [Pseudobdellovibrionaceae bacterium]
MTITQHLRALLVCTALVSPLALGGCSVESESWMNEARLEVHDDEFTDTFETAKLDSGMLHAISTYYYRYGNGPLQGVVSFDPASKTNTRAKAEQAAQNIAKELAAGGVKNPHITVTSAPGVGDTSTTLITFPAIVAKAPTGCGLMPGLEKPGDLPKSGGVTPDYRFGCSVESILAQQVSRPSDLLGKPGFETNADGARQERVLSTRGYYGDKPNEDLDGEQATKE